MMLAMLLFVLTVIGVGLALVLGVWLAGRRFDEAAPVTRRWARATGAVLAVWLATTGLLAASGLLGNWALRPPPMLLLLTGTLIGTVVLAFSPFGTRLLNGLSLAALVGYQAFRIPVVLALLFWQGALPIQLTIEGRNWDLVSGLAAVIVAVLAARHTLPRWGLALWNLLGLGLLINIVVLALLSAPLPFRLFTNEPANTIIATLPYIWLPAFLVPAALFGHLLVFRHLLRSQKGVGTASHATVRL